MFAYLLLFLRLAVNITGGLHYAPGLSRVASRGMLGLPGMGTASSSSSSSSSADVLLGPSMTHGMTHGLTNAGRGWSGGVVPGRGPRVWSSAVAGGGPGVAAAPLLGDLLVVGAQMFTALQFILEEKFLVKYKVGV
jgi:hypothetical protein